MTEKARTIAMLLVMTAGCGARQSSGDAAGQSLLVPGARVDSLALPTMDHGRLLLSSLRGKVVVIDVFATWCLPCIAAVPRLKEMQARLGPQGLAVVGLSVDLEGPKVVGPYCEELGVDYPVMLATPEVIEGSQGPLGPLRTLPMMVVIDRQGRVSKVLVGELPHAELERAVLDALSK